MTVSPSASKSVGPVYLIASGEPLETILSSTKHSRSLYSASEGAVLRDVKDPRLLALGEHVEINVTPAVLYAYERCESSSS